MSFFLLNRFFFNYQNLPDEALVDIFLDALDVYKTVDQLLTKFRVFIVITALIFLNIASHICPSYNNFHLFSKI